MDSLTLDTLKQLIEHQDSPCVSIYLPTFRTMPDATQNPVRLKNLLNQAEQQLNANGNSGAKGGALLQPARDLMGDYNFWEYQSDGLALFLAPGVFHKYRVAIPFPELVMVAKGFHTKPLMSLFIDDSAFHLLALSQNQVKLYEGSRSGMRPVQLDKLPKNLSDALQLEFEKQIQFHGVGKSQAQGGNAIYHSHGSSTDFSKEYILQYFREIDKALHEYLRDSTRPLVLAGVEYLHPIYREANSYGHLLEDGVFGNAEVTNEQDLHRQAWTVIEKRLQTVQEQAKTRYREAKGQRANSDLNEIVAASSHGRVDTLFVATGVQRWGVWDADRNKVDLHEQKQDGDTDLLNLAAQQTILNRGRVYAVKPEAMPDGGTIAAVYRYQR